MLIVAAIVWSTSGLGIKLLGDWDGLAIWGARNGVVAVLFAVWLKPKTLRFNRWEWLGAFAYMGLQLCFILGTLIAPAANIIFLQYTSIVFIIPLGYWWLGERVRSADLIAMLIIISGMLLFFGGDLSLDTARGNLFGIASAVCGALMTVALRRQKEASPANSILLGSAISLVISIPALVQTNYTLPTVGMILYLGIFQIGLGFALYTQAIKHVPAVQATLLVMLEPIFNPVWVFLVLGELPARWAVVGALLVVVGVIYRALAGVKRRRVAVV